MTPIPPRPRGLGGRFKCWVTGTDATLLALCPQRDHDSVGAMFWLQLAVWLWQTLLFSLVLHLMLAPSGIVRPELIGVAVLLATMIALLDSFMIIRASWYFHGMAELKRGGLVLAPDYGAVIKQAVFFALRLLMAIAFSLLVGAFAAILILQKDATAKRVMIQKEKNALLLADLAAQFDSISAGLRSERGQAAEAVAKAEDDASALRRSAAAPLSDDPELKITADSLARLEAIRTTAETALDRARSAYAQGAAAARRLLNDETRAAALRRAAARYAAVKERFDRATQNYQEARQHLADLRAGMASATTRRNQLTDGRLEQAEASRKANLVRLAELDAELTRRATSREAEIARALEANPGYVPYEDGLLAQVHALHELMTDPWNAGLVILLDAVFFALELAAVLAKSLTFIPSTYATLLAKEDYLRAHAAARSIAEQAGRGGDPGPASEPSPAPVDEPPPQPGAPPMGMPEPVHEADPDDEPATAVDADGRPGIRQSLQEAASLARARAARSAKAATRSDPLSGESARATASAASDPPRRPRGRPPGARTHPRDEADRPPAQPPDRSLLRLVMEDNGLPDS